MPLQLTKPVDVGEVGAADCSQIDIVFQAHLSGKRKGLRLVWEYGNTVDGVWVTGPTPHGKKTQEVIDDQDYFDLISTHKPSVADELTFVTVKKAFYQHLIDTGLIPPGAVV